MIPGIAIPMALATAWILLGLASMARATKRPLRSPTSRIPVTVLKPLAGADPNLEQNLRSIFEQDHPSYEVLLGVELANDPAAVVAQRVRAQYPHVPSRLVVTSGREAKNPKVRNLLGLLPHAAYDLCVISDSNVRTPPDYLSDLVRTREREGAGLVTSLVVGTGEQDLGSAAECAQLNGFCTPSSCLPTSVGSAAIIGKSILFSRAELERLGGLEKVADVLAEDFVLGKMYQHAGFRLAVASTIIENVTGQVSTSRFFARQQRWAALRWRVAPAGFVLEGITSPFVLLLVAVVFGGPDLVSWAVPWMLSLAIVRDLGGWLILRGLRRAWIPLLVLPYKEAISLAAWLTAPFARTITWRGRRLRLGAGTILYTARSRRSSRRSFPMFERQTTTP